MELIAGSNCLSKGSMRFGDDKALRSAVLATCTRDGCNSSHSAPWNKPNLNPQHVNKYFESRGWDTGRGLCPNCNPRKRSNRRGSPDAVKSRRDAVKSRRAAVEEELHHISPFARVVATAIAAEANATGRTTDEVLHERYPVADECDIVIPALRATVTDDEIAALFQPIAPIMEDAPVSQPAKPPLLTTGRTMTVEERGFARILLNDIFDAGKGLYAPGWNDQRVADDLNKTLDPKTPETTIRVADVVRYRENAYGPLLSTPEMEDLRELVRGIENLFAQKVAQIERQLGEMKAMREAYEANIKRWQTEELSKDRESWKAAEADIRKTVQTLQQSFATVHTRMDDYARKIGVRV